MELLALPNVTRDVPALERNADDIRARFERVGAAMEVVGDGRAAPVVIGRLACEAPTATLGIYVHYDGQPVDASKWTSAPFEPTLASRPWHQKGQVVPVEDAGGEARLYARGAADDKAPLAVIPGAVLALESAGLKRTVDLVFLFEGEEESGSPNLDLYMRQLADRLVADAWLLCDGPVHQSRAPMVAFGARGYSGFDLTFYGPERELHSGHYGNWVPNPALELSRFLASCKDDRGRVTIPGFYDLTEVVTSADRDAIATLPPVEQGLTDDLGFAHPEVSDSTLVERLLLPSFNVRGLQSADVGDSGRNVIPSQATASVDMRLASGDDPDRMIDLVRDHLVSQDYVVLHREPTGGERRTHSRLAKLDPAPGYRAARIPMGSPLAQTLLDVCRRASGEEVVAMPTFGGSVPLYLFEDIVKSPVAILPIANHDNNQHAPDENIRLANLWYGVALWATLLTTDFSAIRD